MAYLYNLNACLFQIRSVFRAVSSDFVQVSSRKVPSILCTEIHQNMPGSRVSQYCINLRIDKHILNNSSDANDETEFYLVTKLLDKCVGQLKVSNYDYIEKDNKNVLERNNNGQFKSSSSKCTSSEKIAKSDSNETGQNSPGTKIDKINGFLIGKTSEILRKDNESEKDSTAAKYKLRSKEDEESLAVLKKSLKVEEPESRKRKTFNRSKSYREVNSDEDLQPDQKEIDLAKAKMSRVLSKLSYSPKKRMKKNRSSKTDLIAQPEISKESTALEVELHEETISGNPQTPRRQSTQLESLKSAEITSTYRESPFDVSVEWSRDRPKRSITAPKRYVLSPSPRDRDKRNQNRDRLFGSRSKKKRLEKSESGTRDKKGPEAVQDANSEKSGSSSSGNKRKTKSLNGSRPNSIERSVETESVEPRLNKTKWLDFAILSDSENEDEPICVDDSSDHNSEKNAKSSDRTENLKPEQITKNEDMSIKSSESVEKASILEKLGLSCCESQNFSEVNGENLSTTLPDCAAMEIKTAQNLQEVSQKDDEDKPIFETPIAASLDCESRDVEVIDLSGRGESEDAEIFSGSNQDKGMNYLVDHSDVSLNGESQVVISADSKIELKLPSSTDSVIMEETNYGKPAEKSKTSGQDVDVSDTCTVENVSERSESSCDPSPDVKSYENLSWEQFSQSQKLTLKNYPAEVDIKAKKEENNSFPFESSVSCSCSPLIKQVSGVLVYPIMKIK